MLPRTPLLPHALAADLPHPRSREHGPLLSVATSAPPPPVDSAPEAAASLPRRGRLPVPLHCCALLRPSALVAGTSPPTSRVPPPFPPSGALDGGRRPGGRGRATAAASFLALLATSRGVLVGCGVALLIRREEEPDPDDARNRAVRIFGTQTSTVEGFPKARQVRSMRSSRC